MRSNNPQVKATLTIPVIKKFLEVLLDLSEEFENKTITKTVQRNIERMKDIGQSQAPIHNKNSRQFIPGESNDINRTQKKEHNLLQRASFYESQLRPQKCVEIYRKLDHTYQEQKTGQNTFEITLSLSDWRQLDYLFKIRSLQTTGPNGDENPYIDFSKHIERIVNYGVTSYQGNKRLTRYV